MAKNDNSGSGKVVTSRFLKFLTYVVFLLTALLSLFLICNIVLGWLDIKLPEILISVVSQIQNIALIVVVCLGAWEYVATKGNGKRNLFWAAVIVIIVGLILGIGFNL